MRIILVFLLGISLGFSQNIEIKNLKVNNDLDHFAAVFNKGKVFFSHNLTYKKGKPMKDRFNGNVYTLFEAYFGSDKELNNIKPVKNNKGGQFNISVATFTKDGKYMYFTTNNNDVGENKRGDFNTYNLQLQRAEFVEGKGWTNFEVLPFCKKDYNYGHPSLSPDEKTLYFVANIDGTRGRTDIFKVSVNNHTTYGEPIQLNETINSPRTEIYTFVSADNKLYFSSNREGGFGGYDIYSYDLNSTDQNQIPAALPKPINSIGEDFSFYLKDDLKSGFLTSRRTKGKGRDDLYYFTNF